jgi:hypothetical protein
MAQRTKQRLDDVKLTLQRLQRITSESADLKEPAPEIFRPAAEAKSARAFEWVERTAQAVSPPNGRKPLLITAALCLALLIGAASYNLWPGGAPRQEVERTAAVAVDVPERPPVPERPASASRDAPASASHVTSDAQEMIDTGKVEAARRLLSEIAKQSPEAALMLARSYDPNFLRFISFSDAAADPKEAERWYRTWHEIASQKGLVMEAERLERIIKAMK